MVENFIVPEGLRVVKKISFVSSVAACTFLVVLFIARAADNAHRVNLPTSKMITTPVPGYLGQTNSFPATIAISPDQHYAALLNQGYGTQDSGVRQSIAILDLATDSFRDFPDDRLVDDARQSYFIGLAFSSDGKHLYASMGSVSDPTGEQPGNLGNGIAIYKFAVGQITPERFIKIPPQPLSAGKDVAYGLRKTPSGTAIPYPAGFAVLSGASGDRLLIADNLSDNVILMDVGTGKILQAFDLSRETLVPAAYPYTVVANNAGTKGWVSLWNDSSVAELNLGSGKIERWLEFPKPKDAVSPRSHPSAMVLSPKEDVLYVALSNGDAIAAVDLERGKTFIPYVTRARGPGTEPQSLVLSPDNKRLFAATAALDAVAVFDIEELASLEDYPLRLSPPSYIPTEWYPSALAVTRNALLIASAKGKGTGPNNMEAKVQRGPYKRTQPYIVTLLGGSIQRLSFADIHKNLADYTKQVEEDNLLNTDPGKFAFAGGKNPIRHVIYILKENRTYDQILGDLSFASQPIGDGDRSLTMYGADITPNEHRLALQFGVLDNFYDSGEVSGDGHVWSTAATTSDYNEKTWQIAYRGKERTYDFGGTVSDVLPIEHDIPDVDDPGTGFIWDNLARSGLTYRIYGEFVGAVWCHSEKKLSPTQGTPSALWARCPSSTVNQGESLPTNVGDRRGGPSPWPWPVPLFNDVRPSKASLRGHFDPKFPDFNTDYPDQLRADEFLREFDEFVKARGNEHQLPQFVLLYLPDDHTGGTRPGKPTPQASVADNDLAVGRVVDAVSHSPYWDDTAIFVIEDDAQNGVDHVDAHRSIALVISKYSPRQEKPFVEHHFFTTVSMVHTMESLLGLEPMNLFDAHAPLMTSFFSGDGSQAPYSADDTNLRNGLVYKVNETTAPGAKASLRMDFSRPDAADAQELNAILWQDAKGSANPPGQSFK
jgi:DNA-binding beta-propeller fold protein YncE